MTRTDRFRRAVAFCSQGAKHLPVYSIECPVANPEHRDTYEYVGGVEVEYACIVKTKRIITPNKRPSTFILLLSK